MLFLSYIFLGLSLSAPIGPINAAQMDKGIKYGFMHAWLVGFGAMAADLVFMMLIFFGGAQFLDMPFLKTLLWSFGCFVLIYTGAESILSAGKAAKKEDMKTESKGKSFMAGFMMALSNPLNILFWFGIYGSVLAKTAEASLDKKDVFLNSAGIFVGIFLWDLLMALIAGMFKQTMAPKLLKIISQIAGAVLIGFGLYFGWQAYKELFM
ncbi:LysE family transporter [Falsibacillus pallidus]|uniref:Threonine/homoserine/homoserine lactone efflux protein n=1 Tax=Falsibacillus pallidus TaxID=493781 RepID=A0A370GFC6_9BACI|nr:LysE family transporter [Falsibacillus pallidus]RDI41896.1 threonine/homoserine/homoserine lactone efflux protein [Falsibacillus pallidus]